MINNPRIRVFLNNGQSLIENRVELFDVAYNKKTGEVLDKNKKVIGTGSMYYNLLLVDPIKK